MKKLFVLLFSVFIFAACKTVQEAKETAVNCRYTLMGVRATEYSLSDITLEAALAVSNMSKTNTAKMKRFEGKLYVNNNEMTDISFGAAEVPPSSTDVVKATMTASYTKIGKNIAGLVSANSTSLQYKIIGKIYFDTPLGEIPFPIVVQQQLKD